MGVNNNKIHAKCVEKTHAVYKIKKAAKSTKIKPVTKREVEKYRIKAYSYIM